MKNNKIKKNTKKSIIKKTIAIIIIIGLLLSAVALSLRLILVKAASNSTLTATILVTNTEINAVTDYAIKISDTQTNIKYFEYSHNYSIFLDYLPVVPGFFITKISNNTIKVVPTIKAKSYSLIFPNMKNPAFEMSESSCLQIDGLFYVIYTDNSQATCQTNLVRTTAPFLKISNDSTLDSTSGRPIQLNFTLDAGTNVKLSEINIKLYDVKPLYFGGEAFCTINGRRINSFFNGITYFRITVPEDLKSPFNVVLDKSMNIITTPEQKTLKVEYRCTPTNSGFIINRGSPVSKIYTLQKYVYLDTPNITFPKNSSILDYVGSATKIEWNNCEGATEYTVSLNKKDKITGVSSQTYITVKDTSLSLFLQEFTQYTVKVNAKDALGVATSYGNPIIFLVNPQNISSLSPANNSFIPENQPEILFSILNAKTGSTYKMQIGQTKDFSVIAVKIADGVFAETINHISIPTASFETGNVYFWRVKETLKPSNYELPWTEIKSFTISQGVTPFFNDKPLDGTAILKQNPFVLNYTNPEPSKILLISFYNESKKKFLASLDLEKSDKNNVLLIDLPIGFFNYSDTFSVKLEFKDKTFSTSFDEMKFILMPYFIELTSVNIIYNEKTKKISLTWPLPLAQEQIKIYKIYLFTKNANEVFVNEKIIDSNLNSAFFDLSQYGQNTTIYFKIQTIPLSLEPLALDKIPYYSFAIPKVEDRAPPSLTIVSPLDESRFYGDPKIKITGTLTDSDSGPLKILIGDSTEIAVEKNGQFSFDFILSNGENIITVFGFDNNLNATGVTIVLYFQKEKIIELFVDKKEATINGENILLDVSPFIQNGRTMVPLRFISESMGFEVLWNSLDKTVLLKSDNLQKTIILTISSKIAKIIDSENNISYFSLDAPAIIIGGRTMVPLRFITEQFGGKIIYNTEARKITIKF
jgi:hypothetical protein